MTPQQVIRLLSLLTLISNIGVVLFIFLLVPQRTRQILRKKISKYALSLSFLIALIATSGSLYFSEVAHFEPCKLCWYQRILMYPLVFVLGTALLRSRKASGPENLRPGRDVWNYVLPLSITGGLIAAYHYYYQVTGNPLLPCSTVGFSVSCSERFFTYYGYITIPWMSLSAFILITFGMFLLGLSSKK